MNAAKRGFLFLLFLFLAASITLLIPAASAQVKPSAPEFSAKYVDFSYDRPPVLKTNPYTGETIVTQEGYRIDNRSIQFTIKNQPYSPLPQLNGNITGLFFNFRIKGSYGADWDYTPFAENGWTTSTYGGTILSSYIAPAPAYAQSNTEYTTVTVTIPGAYRVPQGATLDVQVQAIAGQMWFEGKGYRFEGQFGDWSNTQTITVTTPPTSNDASSPYTQQSSTTNPPTSPTPSPFQEGLNTNSTQTPIQPAAQTNLSLEPDWTTVAAIAFALGFVVLLGVVVVQQRSLRRIRLQIEKKAA
jgi:hypothetical protein